MPLFFFAIHETKDINDIQLQPDARPPNAQFLSTWSCPSMWFICLICQCGCTGSSRYTSDTSDLNKMWGELGLRRCMDRRNSPRWCKLSNGYPMMSSWGIMPFKEYFPALWWVTMHRSVEWGLGMANIGVEYSRVGVYHQMLQKNVLWRFHGHADLIKTELLLCCLVLGTISQMCQDILLWRYWPMARNPHGDLGIQTWQKVGLDGIWEVLQSGWCW